MSLVTYMMRRYVGRTVKNQMRAEFDDWRRSGVPPTEYARARVPAVADAISSSAIGDAALRLRSDRASSDRLASRTESSADWQQRAEGLSEAADEARARLAQLEESAEALPGKQAQLDTVRSEAEQRVQDLTEQARTESDQRVDVARKRLTEIEDRAALHVEEVRRRAQMAANSIVSRAEAEFAHEEAQLQAALEQARIDARVAAERAEEAMVRAKRAAERVADTAESALDVQRDGSRRRRSLLDNVIAVANQRVERAEEGRRRYTASGAELTELDSLDRQELYSMARELEISGRSRMSKDDLARSIREAADATTAR